MQIELPILIQKSLEHIREHAILPPLFVLDILRTKEKSKLLNFGLVKYFLLNLTYEQN